MSETSKQTSIVMPSVAEDKVITAAAKSDPDAQPLTPTQLKAMVPLKALRGRPKLEKQNNWSPCATAPRLLSISNQLAMVGNLEWMKCY